MNQMTIELKAKLPDKPGTLIRMLKPISDNAGNISTVMHMHEEKRGGKVPVIVRFELPVNSIEEKLQQITTELQSQSIEIVEITNLNVTKEVLTAIMTGHVFETDFVDTYKRINSAGGKISRIEAMFTDPKDISNVKFDLQCDKADIKKILEELRTIVHEKNLTLITDR